VNALRSPAKNMISAMMKMSMPTTPLGATSRRRGARGTKLGVVTLAIVVLLS
jgi:hypothetical protein